MRIIIILILVLALFWAWPKIFDDTPSTIPPDSPLAQLSNVEKQYYQQIFDYTMEAVKPGGSYGWESAGNSGTISVSKNFLSKSGSNCRIFNERFFINGVEGNDSGVGCKREGREGWCRLRKQDALTCAMENPGGIFGLAPRESQDVIESGKGLLGKIQGWWR